MFAKILSTIENAKLSRDEKTIVVAYGSLGYYRLTPTTYYRGAEEFEGVEIEGKLTRKNGSHHDELKKALAGIGIEAY